MMLLVLQMQHNLSTDVGYHMLSLVTAILITQPVDIHKQHVTVYREDGRFGGWPANNGIWCWGNEIVVGFTLGYHDETASGHTIDRKKPIVPRQARSTDGGLTWTFETPSYLERDGSEPTPTPCPGHIDFTQRDFALTFRMHHTQKNTAYFCWSNDRCKTWQGPYTLPNFNRIGMLPRTDYLVENSTSLTAFMAATKEDGSEGWPMMIRTSDGGKTWQQVSWIGEQPKKGGYAIMPSTVRLSESELFTYIRRRSDADAPEKRWWIEPFRSLDNGKTWKLEEANSIDNAGNPAAMIKLKDGRLALTYGYRRAPFGIRAKLSSDGGRSWSKEIILREDGANWDLGYPRTVQREDGKLVTVYYFNDNKNNFRHITATIWEPPARVE
jgi:hypothetical protein